MTGLLELDGDDKAATLGAASLATASMDGLIAGVALCPVALPTDEWIRFALGGKASDDDAAGLFGMLRAVMGPRMQGFVDKAVERMQAGRYVPMHGGNPAIGLSEALWSFWIVGFGRVLTLRPAAWASYDADPATREALAELRAIRELEPRLQTATEAEIARLDVEVPPRIDRAIAALVASRLGAPLRVRRSTVARLAGPLIGRNAPCPCGSGKKHKHCCGR